MIEIRQNTLRQHPPKWSIEITGHAGYAPHGQDIVCAGVSTLVQTLVQSIDELTNDAIEYYMVAGKVIITHGNLSATAQSLVDSFFVGVQMIADTYPDHVVLNGHKAPTKP